MGTAEKSTVHSMVVTLASMISLLTLCPPFVILLWYTMVHADGSIALSWEYFKQHGFQGLKTIWPLPSLTAWKLSSLMANGMQAYVVTLVTYLSLWWFGIFNPAIVYDHLGEIYSALIVGSFVFCILLHIKGYLVPSSTDSGSSGNLIIDFYWGMELYPRIGKSFDIKVFTNCRFGMMSWAVLSLTYCIKQNASGCFSLTFLRIIAVRRNRHVSDSMLVNTILMLVYVSKFFWWESGYWNTMDIAHDRAGFYICWGCLVWVPSVYTSPGMYLVNHPVNLGLSVTCSVDPRRGLLCIYINYDCDWQRQHFRKTNGRCSIWGKTPWGLARHFHYVPEILASFFWTAPALFSHCLPYFYVVYLTILLTDRAKRDDDRCSTKYGKYWKMYCQRVPYRIVPGVY
ncbi:unnamed protein product [Spirodela intermedia]|uniref:7-dehydrocholesterol reductase n=1 Tax=Spirodela intermedia TaxID=51605 RepID=A0A7I8JMW5_SPIIN|nr:unnamed protein product [Spirodela intermedia]CAA6671151.1 unnamed protein product [Spirodela intermedia]